MTGLEVIKVKSDILVSWLSLLGVAGAIIFGLSQYHSDTERKIDDTQKTTLAFISRYNQPEMLAARSKVQISIEQLAEELKADLRKVRALEEINVRSQKFYKDHAIKKLRMNEAYFEALLIIRFFDELWI